MISRRTRSRRVPTSIRAVCVLVSFHHQAYLTNHYNLFGNFYQFCLVFHLYKCTCKQLMANVPTTSGIWLSAICTSRLAQRLPRSAARAISTSASQTTPTCSPCRRYASAPTMSRTARTAIPTRKKEPLISSLVFSLHQIQIYMCHSLDSHDCAMILCLFILSSSRSLHRRLPKYLYFVKIYRNIPSNLQLEKVSFSTPFITKTNYRVSIYICNKYI